MVSQNPARPKLDFTVRNTIAFVCTGNICRSPFAQLLLADRAPSLSVTSAGIGALEGEPMDPNMADELRARGVDPSGFTARQVTSADLTADLILVMSLRQRDYLLQEWPSVVSRIGLLGAVENLPSLRAADIGRWARGAGLDPSAQIPDPYRKGPEMAARTARRLESHLRTLAALAEDSPRPGTMEA